MAKMIEADYDKQLKALPKSSLNYRVKRSDPFKNRSTAIAHVCPSGHSFMGEPGRMLVDRHRCGECHNKLTLWTEPKYDASLLAQYEGEIERLEPFINTSTPILHRCPHDEFTSDPSALLKGHRPRCCYSSRRLLVTEDEFSAAIKDSGLTYVSGYINQMSNVAVICDARQHQIERKADYFLRGGGCSSCTAIDYQWSATTIQEAITVKFNGRITLDADSFVSAQEPAAFSCMAGHEFQMRPSHLIHKNANCPECSKIAQSSIEQFWLLSVEEKLGRKLQGHHSDKRKQFMIPGTGYKADGYDPETNTIYEYLGADWHGDLNMYHPMYACHPRDKSLTAASLAAYVDRRTSDLEALGFIVINKWESELKVENGYMHPKALELRKLANGQNGSLLYMKVRWSDGYCYGATIPNTRGRLPALRLNVKYKDGSTGYTYYDDVEFVTYQEFRKLD